MRLKSLTLAFGAALLLAACGGGDSAIRNETATPETAQQLAEKARSELSYDEYQLLDGYVERVHPGLPEGELPTGISIGTMIESQRDFLRAQAATESGEESEATAQTQDRSSFSEAPSAPPAPAPPTRAPASDQSRAAASQPTPAETRVEEETASPNPPSSVTVPAGTQFNIRLAETVSSEVAEPGDSFEATLDDDLIIDGTLVAPAGSTIVGKIPSVESSGKVKGRANMSMTLARIYVADEAYALNTNTLRFEAEGSGKDDAKKIGIASGIGAVIGAIAGGGKGAAIGGAIGAGAGTGVVLATPGDEVEFQVEQLFNFDLQQDTEMKALGG